MIAPQALDLLVWGSTLVTAKIITIDNVSPMIRYRPPLYGVQTYGPGYNSSNPYPTYGLHWTPTSAANRWQTTFPGITYEGRVARVLTENHFTWSALIDNAAAPSLELSFVGTGITLFGPVDKPLELVSPGSAELRVDGRNEYTAFCDQGKVGGSQTSCEVDNLPFGRHSATVTVQMGMFAIGFFEIETGREE